VVATSPDDDDVLEVILGHHCLRAPAPVSHSEAMDMAHSTQHQVRHVLQWERDELEAEQHVILIIIEHHQN
jgi:hypothetical protein